MQTATSVTHPVKVPLATEPLGVLGSLKAARQNVLRLIPQIAVEQPMVSGPLISNHFGKRWHMVMDPAANRQVLRENLDNYPKSDVTKNILRPAVGESLFVAEGAHWRWQRRAAAPAFSHRNVAALGPMMTRAATASTDRLTAALDRHVDVHAEMTRATFEVISDVTFSGDAGFDQEAMHHAIDNYIDQIAKVSILDMFGVPNWVPRPSRLFSSTGLKSMKTVADSTIDARRTRAREDTPDLLDLLLEGSDPKSGREMTTAELRDNLLTFIVAGHETTALTLSWALYLMAEHAEIQESAAAEARAHLGDRPATQDDLDALPLTRQIIDETLRLYPPAAFLSRSAQAPDTLGGREVAKGDTVILPIYALHRNKLLWDDPDAFRPERFADPRSIDRFAYLPFGDGPRICIGANFALQEAVIILATLLAQFRFAPTPGKTPKPVMILTLRPEGGVWLKVTAR